MLQNRWPVVVATIVVLILTWIPWKRMGREFMPPLQEGTILYMPTTLPGISIARAREILRIQDSVLKSFPEVASVWGKAGRANTATDPAGLDMFETTIALKPESQWRSGMTQERLVTMMDSAVRVTGVTNAWTMPIKGRIDMLATGIRTPVGIKIFGPDLAELERVGKAVESSVRAVRGTRSVFAAEEARRIVERDVKLPVGYSLAWSGQYEYMQRAAARMKLVVPATLAIIFMLLYSNFRSISESLIVMLSVPFALVGGFWFVWALGYNWSVAVAIGFIALSGVATETGVVMLIYLDNAWKARQKDGERASNRDLYDAIVEGAVERVRPKIMTVTAIMAGLLPILWGNGAGASVMKRIAAPMVGGMISSTILTLVVIPAVYALVREGELSRAARKGELPTSAYS